MGRRKLERDRSTAFSSKFITCPDSLPLGLVRSNVRRTKTKGSNRLTLLCIVFFPPNKPWILSQFPSGWNSSDRKVFQALAREKVWPTAILLQQKQSKTSISLFHMRSAPAQHREGPHTNHGFRTWALGGNSTETSNTLHIIQMKRCWCWRGERHSSWRLSIWNSATVTVSGLDSRTVFLKQQEPCLLHQF